MKTWKAHKGMVTGLAFSPDGSGLVSAGVDRCLRLWDSLTGQERWHLQYPLDPKYLTLAFSPDGRHLAVGGNGPMEILDPTTGAVTARLSPKHISGQLEINDLAFQPDGRKVFVCGAEETTLFSWEVD